MTLKCFTTPLYLRRALLRSQILRESAPYSPVPPAYFHALASHLSTAFAAGTYLKDGPPSSSGSSAGSANGNAPQAPPNPLSDPRAMDGMLSGLKTQGVMMVPQMLLMGWINFFFQGFVLSKLILTIYTFLVSFLISSPQ